MRRNRGNQERVLHRLHLPNPITQSRHHHLRWLLGACSPPGKRESKAMAGAVLKVEMRPAVAVVYVGDADADAGGVTAGDCISSDGGNINYTQRWSHCFIGLPLAPPIMPPPCHHRQQC